MLQALIFDLVGVLVLKKQGFIPHTPDELNADNIEKLFNHTDDAKLLTDIKQKLKLSDSEIAQALPRIAAKYEINQPLWDLLPSLHTRYKLAIINNGNAIALKEWRRRFDFSLFDVFVNSALEGIRKPDPAIYKLTCQKLGAFPSGCLFIDDLQENIDGAQALGMQTMLWQQGSPKNMEDECVNLLKSYIK